MSPNDQETRKVLTYLQAIEMQLVDIAGRIEDFRESLDNNLTLLARNNDKA